jgi:hypothetical protein
LPAEGSNHSIAGWKFMTYGLLKTIVLAASLFAFALPGPIAAQGRDTDAAPLSLDALPPPAPGFERSDGIKPQPEKDSGLKSPAKIELGAAQLRLDTNRKDVDQIPRVGIDAADQRQLNRNITPEKPSELKPDYFGFTLSTPTH